MKHFTGRLYILGILFLIWAGGCFFQLIRYTLIQSGELRAESRKIAWRSGLIPPMRGRILDKNGVPLAWTSLERDAVLTHWPATARGKENLIRSLKQKYALDIPSDAALPRILIRNLSPDQFQSFMTFCRRNSGLIIQTRIERKQVEYPAIRSRLGTCRTGKSGILTGTAGWEKEQDPVLAGIPGHYHVMLDRYGQWIPDTLRIEQESQPGKDIRLEYTLAELQQEVIP